MATKQLAKAVTSMGMSQRASERAPFCYALELHPDGLLSIFYWPIDSSKGGFFMPKTRQSRNNRWGWRFLPSPLKVTEPNKKGSRLASFFALLKIRYQMVMTSFCFSARMSSTFLLDSVTTFWISSSTRSL